MPQGKSDLLFFASANSRRSLKSIPFSPRHYANEYRTTAPFDFAGRPRNDTSVTALVAASAAVPMAELAGRLTNALAGYCKVLHVDRKRLQAILGAPDESAAAREILVNTRFPAWLSSEQGHTASFCSRRQQRPRWTESCISQADQVADGGTGLGQPGAVRYRSALRILSPRRRGSGRSAWS